MNTFIDLPAQPEHLLWCAVIHQAVRDLGHPNSNQSPKQTLMPLNNETFRSAMQLVFSGKEDKHKAWEYSGMDPKSLRADIIDKMRKGETVGQVGSRETPMGPINYREVRRLVFRAFDQADHFYRNRKESPLIELFARDCHMDFLSLYGEAKRWGKAL